MLFVGYLKRWRYSPTKKIGTIIIALLLIGEYAVTLPKVTACSNLRCSSRASSCLHRCCKQPSSPCTPCYTQVLPCIPHTFEINSPAEFHVPANRKVVRTSVELRNTSRCWIRIARICPCCGCWKWGIVPSWEVDFDEDQPGPVDRDSLKLGIANLSGDRIRPAKLANPMTLEFQLNDSIAPGDRETFHLTLSLTNTRTGAIQTVDWAIDVVIRESGKPLLISEKIPYPSEEGN